MHFFTCSAPGSGLWNLQKKGLHCAEQCHTGMQMIQAEIERMNASAKLLEVTPEQKAEKDRRAWQAWLARYAARLHREAAAGAHPQKRVQTMNATNPRYDWWCCMAALQQQSEQSVAAWRFVS